jgi:SAM-dependent methyltransferase
MNEPTLAEHWEERYRERSRAWSGNANPTLVAVAAELTPGTAIDLACGEGADVIWLAENGWTATGVDISPTAVARGREAAAELPATFVAADLSEWEPEGKVDLVCSSFMHSEIDFPRIEILRTAATWVAPGGHFLMVTHAEAPWWSALAHHDHVHLPSPEQDAADLALDTREWEAIEVGVRERDAVSPDGEHGVMRDGVLLFRRRV